MRHHPLASSLLELFLLLLSVTSAYRREPASSTSSFPSSYTLANFPSSFSPSFHGDSFLVYSKPMTTRYGEACNERQAPIPLPDAIVQRFNGSVIAITGLEVDVVVLDKAMGQEIRTVPNEDFYNHHYILGLRSSLYLHPPEGENEEKQLAEIVEVGGTGEIQGGGGRPGVHRRPVPEGGLRRGLKKTRRPPPPLPTSSNGSGETNLRPVPPAISLATDNIPLIQVFCEANGGEYKASYHGYPRGYAQLLHSPAYFWPFQLHFINTRASVSKELVPSSSRAGKGAKWNGLIECPCSDRRVFDVEANTVDGKPPYPINCQGEVEAQNNTVCSLATYQGGLRCCEPGMVLLDAAQRQPEEEDTYVLKVRFWYEEYKEKGEKEEVVMEGIAGGGGGGGGAKEEGREMVRASHAHLFKLYIQTEQNAGEYDVPPCDARTTPDPSQCVHVLTSLNKASELFTDCSFVTNKDCADEKALAQSGGRFKLMYAAGHMHVGGLSLELINADTGALLCKNVPIYDEQTGLISSIPPCVWGDNEEEKKEGFPSPPTLTADTRLLSIARYNSSGAGHVGVMASWQMRGAYV